MMCVIFSLYALAIFHLQLSDGAGFTSHNTFARRSSQFEYFGPQSDQYNTAAFYGLARDRSDAIQGFVLSFVVFNFKSALMYQICLRM